MHRKTLKRSHGPNAQRLRRATRGRRRTVRGIPNHSSVSFNTGYDSGFNDGYNRGYDAAFDKGVFEGGEAVVGRLLPGHVILPGIPVESIIAAGITHFEEHFLPLLPASEVYGMIQNALQLKEPLSVVRLGDGELLTMAQGLLSMEQLEKDGSFLHYAGIDLPDFAARDELLQAVLKSSVIGIPKSRYRTFSPLAVSIFEHYGLPYRSMVLTESTINYALYLDGYLKGMLTGVKVLLIGNAAPDLQQKLNSIGVDIVDAIAPVQGIHDVPRVMGEVRLREFDLALVAAGVPAVVLSQRIATELGKVAVDFGHLANKIVSGEASL